MTGHQPIRPTWACDTCGGDWPCPPAREALTAEHAADPVALGVYMAVQLGHAAGDMPEATARDLYRRFIVWTRPLPLDAERLSWTR
ncbi:hypothetical protein RB614_40510 [Phytohabitans sp. ZYX-F-186]|uniref:Flavin reductase n=1 Tax=Phytohabitans maris TaxID=3071409 RepID=A0ABU0ZV20_9ACTN|nr:hypothetical protein [Phytohabitans sp. ZYX-F-186]MDQ7910793.1 hypothetical protein [Phytohabitans sp. ZYX-F-186]